MICKKPYRKGGAQFGCGQCLPCRFNKARLWTHRIMLESAKHGDATFATLTYRSADGPVGTLVPYHLQRFLKRLRRDWGKPIRFFGVGEYGDDSFRPHYHVILFGVPNCLYGRTARDGCDCSSCSRIANAWGLGNVYLGSVTAESARYVSGYVVKKMRSPDDARLNGRYPEFARMSLRPGIGATAMGDVAQALASDAVGAASIARAGDVPLALNHGRRSLPLGRYLRRKLREELGFDELGQTEVQRLRQEAERVLTVQLDPRGVSKTLAAEEDERIARVHRMEKRAQLFPKLGKL